MYRLCCYGGMSRKLQCHNLTFFRNVSSERTHYDTLEVDKSASQEDIKQAYLKKAKEIHPDSNPSDSSSHDRFVELNNAYDMLSTPSTRQYYDDMISRRSGDSESWRRHTQPPHQKYEGFAKYQAYYNSYKWQNEPPPTWEKYFQRRDLFYEEDYDKLTFWQRHWAGVFLFILIQLHVFAGYYMVVDKLEKAFEQTWFYDNMNEEEFEIYINQKSFQFDNFVDVFDPEKRKELAEREKLIDKLQRSMTGEYILNIPANYKQLPLPPDFTSNISGKAETKPIAEGTKRENRTKYVNPANVNL